jgi:hypothetical protein
MKNIIGISGKMGSGKDTVGKIIQYILWNPKQLSSPKSFESFLNDKEELRKLNSKWEIKKFAHKLKQIVSILTGISIKDLEKEEVKNSYLSKEWDIKYDKYHYSNKLSVRSMLQKIGTECMRDNLHPDTWVNALFSDYNTKDKNKELGNWIHPNWIITDVRFLNECESIKDRNGIIIRINKENPLIKISGGGDIEAEQYVRDKFKKIENKSSHPSEILLDNYNFDYTINNSGTIEDLVKKVEEILIKENLI